ncbi:MFS transporter [Humibacter sp.]|uniref:MFS transporter n=1 Tax=Humibacter sp. TaxID=1940291 RepID=UPI003F80309A
MVETEASGGPDEPAAGSSNPLAQATMSTCMMGLGVGQLIAGPLSDRYGRRRPLTIGVAAFAVLSLLCAIAPSIHHRGHERGGGHFVVRRVLARARSASATRRTGGGIPGRRCTEFGRLSRWRMSTYPSSRPPR